jgi:hypothetical protein
MSEINQPEFWLRGPVPGIGSLLQPVAHALLQAKQEAASIMNPFPDELLWQRPFGLASPGFHLLHIPGVIDRLFTYARGQRLSPEQYLYLEAESQVPKSVLSVKELLLRLEQRVDGAIAELSRTGEGALRETRGVGRAQIPSTQLGIWVHAAEHAQRHIGQLLVTSTVVLNVNSTNP